MRMFHDGKIRQVVQSRKNRTFCHPGDSRAHEAQDGGEQALHIRPQLREPARASASRRSNPRLGEQPAGWAMNQAVCLARVRRSADPDWSRQDRRHRTRLRPHRGTGVNAPDSTTPCPARAGRSRSVSVPGAAEWS